MSPVSLPLNRHTRKRLSFLFKKIKDLINSPFFPSFLNTSRSRHSVILKLKQKQLCTRIKSTKNFLKFKLKNIIAKQARFCNNIKNTTTIVIHEPLLTFCLNFSLFISQVNFKFKLLSQTNLIALTSFGRPS